MLGFVWRHDLLYFRAASAWCWEGAGCRGWASSAGSQGILPHPGRGLSREYRGLPRLHGTALWRRGYIDQQCCKNEGMVNSLKELVKCFYCHHHLHCHHNRHHYHHRPHHHYHHRRRRSPRGRISAGFLISGLPCRYTDVRQCDGWSMGPLLLKHTWDFDKQREVFLGSDFWFSISMEFIFQNGYLPLKKKVFKEKYTHFSLKVSVLLEKNIFL